MDINRIGDIYSMCQMVKENHDFIKKYKSENERLFDELKEYVKDDEIRNIIINNLHIEDNGEPLFLQSSYYTSSSNGRSEEQEYSYPNVNASFRPSEDEFDIVDCEFNDTHKSFRIKVECIRRRKFVNAFMWEPDYYWTDWIKI